MSQNLSPFHAELLEFLKRTIAERIAVDGYDESSDPELRSFRNSLAHAGGEESLPLSEILETYRHLFETRGPLHLEKKLIAALSSNEERIAVYRGLPRFYRREKPADSHVKKNFAHLPALKRLAIEKKVFRLYEARNPEEGRVTLFTWVIFDGWGDYIAASESIGILRRRFPDLQLAWVVLFPHRLGSPPVPEGVKTHLIYYERETPLSLIGREALEILRTSDMVLQLPTFYPSFDALRSAVEAIPFFTPPPTWLSIGEYGFLESQWFHPRSGNRSMGLHFLEKGVIVKPPRSGVDDFSKLECEPLLHWMFGTAEPGPAEIERYRKMSHFYLAYLTSPIGGIIYLHALAKAHERDAKGIDLCSPDIGWLICFIEMQNQSSRPIFEIEGVSLELHTQGKVVLLNQKAQPKKIRIFSPPTISPADFRLLVCLSDEWLAIRGNQSFTEAISANKCFFFDGREHLRYFMKDLLALAENRIAGHKSTLQVMRGMWKAFLHNVPVGDGEWVEETDFQEREPWLEIALKIGAAMQDPDCLAGFKKLNRILAEEHRFNDFLCHLVQRELCHRSHPEVRKAEEEAVQPFAEERASLSKTIEDLKNRVVYGR